ncbi:MAG: type II CRISPR-associated endonuclease Cas1 [Bacteroidetes bacterium]|jgi:CRISPR-associated protein Cas1|nr:type II CRISPR-associated endonuclease Cas1 [Bacteroidota bacterium]
MIKRTLYFGNPAYLSLSNGQLLVRLPEVEKSNQLDLSFKKQAQATIPVEDIGVVVLDNKQITITHGLMDSLMENNVAVITCNSTRHPTGLLLPLHGNTLQHERYREQIEASEPLRKQLWQQTIIQKIKNQAAVLRSQKIDAGYLFPVYKNVKSGDSENAEATAAAFYWQRVFSNLPEPHSNKLKNGFKRNRGGEPPNHYLNYGYALLRATMARSIVAAGLLPTLGIHHSNRYNAYCLADDLMEPYRPVVDKVVLQTIIQHGIEDELSKEIKASLLSIPIADVSIDGESSPLMIATQRTAVSLVKCFAGEQRKLLYPELSE